MVVDRGDQDVWKLLDAIAEQRPADALAQLRRHLDSASERIPARLSFFALLARFCEQLATVHGLIAALDLPAERNFNRFKAQVLPKLSAELPGGKAHPLMRIHPYRLHRIFQAASARGPDAGRKMAELPWKVLETEVRLKGGSADGDTALEALVVAVAGVGAGEPRGGAARRRRAG